MRMLWTERWYHPPKFTRWNPVPQYNGIWRWGLREETVAGWRFFGTRHVFRITTKVWKLGFLDSVLVNILIATPAIWYSREAYGRNIVNGWFAFKLCYCFLIHLLDSCLLLLSISYPMRYKYRTCFILAQSDELHCVKFWNASETFFCNFCMRVCPWPTPRAGSGKCQDCY